MTPSAAASENMSFRKVIALVISVGISLPGCSGPANLCDTGGRSTIARDDLRQALLADLTKSGVPVQLSSSGAICYESQYRELVVARIIALELERRPANRVSIPDAELARLARATLDQAGVKYQIIDENDSLVLALETDADASKAIKLISELSRRHYESKSAH